MTLTCMIIDDEPLAVKLLEGFVQRTPFLTLKASYTDSIEALAQLRQSPVDLLLLDIQMPDLNGMELAHLLPPQTDVIFTTAFKEYAFESYEVHAIDFLLKPIRYTKFLAATERAREMREQREAASPQPASQPGTYAFLRIDGDLQRIDFDRILYVSGMKDYVMFYLEGESRPKITHMTMKAVEDLLPADRFLRVHRSYIVALSKIRKIDRNNCIYIADEVIHVTDGYRDAFEQRLAANT